MSFLGVAGFSAGLLIGIPTFIVLAGLVFVALLVDDKGPLLIVAQRMFGGLDSFTLMAIPLFNLTAEILRAGKLSDRLIRFSVVLVGHMRGGLGMAAVMACMLFACISGSSPATVIATGSILVPALVQEGYSKRFAIGLVTSAGSLGILIPPSITFIIYGVVTGTSIGALFLAGIVPGILTGLMLMLYSHLYARRQNIPRRDRPSAREILTATREAFWVLLIPVFVLGGIYGGIFTPTEAAAVSVFLGLGIGFFAYRSLKLSDLPGILFRTGLVSGALMILIAGATAFAWFITSEQIPQTLSRAVLGLTDDPLVFLLILNVILLIMGCFVEGASAIVILAPLILPVIAQLGINPVHLGVIFVMNMELGMITPPVGMNLMVARMMTNERLGFIIRSVIPTGLVILAALLLVTYVPALSLALPNAAMSMP